MPKVTTMKPMVTTMKLLQLENKNYSARSLKVTMPP